MRYELKHDKLAAQIYELASTEAKARRKAENIYHMYDEIGANRLLTAEELDYLAQFQPILRPKESLLALIEKSRKELGRARQEAEAKERARLEREKELVKRVKARQQRISWVIGIAGAIAAVLLAFALAQSRKATENQRIASEIRRNLERKSQLTHDLKEEFSALIHDKSKNTAFEIIAYVSELNQRSSSFFIDLRDGKLYEVVEFKEQPWMAENLNFKTPEGSWFYEDKPENGEKYGRLYTWEAARKACPEGWRLPSALEWRRMAAQFGGADEDAADGGTAAYEALAEDGYSNFAALLGGNRRYSGAFGDLGASGYYWSGTETESSRGAGEAFAFNFSGATRALRSTKLSKSLGASCRCVKE